MYKHILTLLLCALPLAAQTAPPTPVPDPLPILAQLQQVSQNTAIDVGRVHIDKWSKNVRDTAGHDADSLRNDVTNTLPGLVAAAQAAPNNIAPAFKLYVNVNALYEVLDGLVGQASTGPKEDYDLLAKDLENLRVVRRAWSDRLQALAQVKDTTVPTTPQVAGTKQVPKKVIVDDTAPAHKRTTKKKPASTPPQ